MLFLADILPTAYEVGVLVSRLEPGDTLAVVGAGPVGLATIMTAKLFTPARIVAIDLADTRLEQALAFGADVVVNNGREDAVAKLLELTDGLGADVAVTRRFATHRYALAHSEKAYDVFADAASSQALKVVLDAEPVRSKHDADRAVAIA